MSDPFHPNPFGPSYPVPTNPEMGTYLPVRDIFRAKLTAKTSVAGIYNYDWTEQTFNPADGTSTDANPARAGSSGNSPAIEINNTSIDVTSPVYVWMRQLGFVGGQMSYEFPAPGTFTPGSTSWKIPVRAATTTTLPTNTYANGTAGVGATLTGNSNGALSAQDGVTLTANQDLLVKDEASGLKKGIYTLTTVGDGSHPYVLKRRTDIDTAAEILGAVVVVEEGTANADTVWLCTADATITVGTTALPWKQIGGASLAYGGVAGTSTSISPDATYVDIGIGVALPGAGTYDLDATIIGSITFGGNDATVNLTARWWDVTAGALVGPTITSQIVNNITILMAYCSTTGNTQTWTMTTTLTMRVTIAGANTFRVDVQRSAVGGATFYSSAPSAKGVMRWKQVA